MNKILVVLFFLLLPALLHAEEVVHVQSRYTSDGTDGDTIISWKFVKDANGAVDVYRDGDQAPLVALLYDQACGELKKVTKYIVRGEQRMALNEEVSGSLILSDGFPVPYDYLSSRDPSTRAEMTLVNKTAGLVMQRHLLRELSEITLKNAAESGFVDTSILPSLSGDMLYLLTVSENGKLLVSQLWEQNGSFWLYEASGERRSWRVSP